MKASQNYESYWKLTVEYTDIHSEKFLGTLQIIVKFIDDNDMSTYSKEKFKELQHLVNNDFKKADMGSVRKSINQFVKLGFVNYELKSYNDFVIEFLKAKTKRRRATLFSKIVYANSSFNSSVTELSEQKEINFLLKTLEVVGSLHKRDIIGLMTVDISDIKKGYLDEEELEKVKQIAKDINFEDRKYNQIGYLWGFLNKLDDLTIVDNLLYFEEDAEVILAEKLKTLRVKRDGYLHRLYKNQLKEESFENLECIKCMVENLAYPSLVASHIKPFIDSDYNEAYDSNNGLLLSRNMDILFDQGYISFSDDGKIIISDNLQDEVKKHLETFSLNDCFINQERLIYLDYHRQNILKNGLL